MITPRALGFAACLVPCGFAVGAETVVENGAAPLPFVEVTVALERADDLAVIDVSEAACSAQDYRADTGVVPVLPPAGQWVFSGGCV